ncbi:MAG: hypothetical protein HYR55_11115 [Acidobacteria bacterium]|nr:hypothetical protein [Acidobacteriota bacterium]MBI3657728.1 hypothetical protein [Acidobacteriota bacterium]
MWTLVNDMLPAKIGPDLYLPFLAAAPAPRMLPGLVLFLLFLIVLVVVERGADRADKTRRLVWLLPCAFLVRGGVAIASTFTALVPPLYTLDAESYDRFGWLIAEAWRGGPPVAPALFESFNSKAYAYWCGSVYYWLGYSPLSMRVINCLFGALLVKNIFQCVSALSNKRAATRAAIVVAFLPSLVFWSSQNFRDGLVFYGLSEVVYSSIRWGTGGNGLWFLRMALAMAFTSVMRISVGAPALALSVPFFVKRARWGDRRWLTLATFCAMGLMLAAGIYFFRGALFGYLDPHKLSALRGRLAANGATNFPALHYENWLDVLIYLPYATGYYLLAPFPWQRANPVQTLASVENLFVVVALALGSVGTVRLWRKQRARVSFAIFYIAALALAGGLVEGNIGTGYRHKMQIIPYFVVWTFAGLNWPLTMRRPFTARTPMKSV